MKKGFLELLRERVLIFDGAMGTMLYARGIFLNQCFEVVNLSRPDLVLEIHKSYIEAGCDAIETNTFGANRVKLASYGLAEQVFEINKKAVAIAAQAVEENSPGQEKHIYIAGSVGPLGVYLQPLGKMNRQEAADIYIEQIKALIAGGVDLILLETFKDIEELLIAAAAARQCDPAIPIQAQFTVGPQDLSNGLKSIINKAVRLDKASAVDVLGINCSSGPADMLEALQAIREYVGKPLAIMPNAGFPKEIEGRLLYLTSPEYMAEYAKRYFAGGVAAIGGCCGTTPQHIREIVKAVRVLDKITHHSAVVTPAEEIREKTQVPLAERSGLGRLLKDGAWVVSVELVPPLGTDLSRIVEKAKKLYQAGVNCVNIPDGPRASSRISTMITAIEIQRQVGIETILHYCCRDRNLIGMQGDLLGAAAVGVNNILVITGDPPKLGGYPDATGVFDVDSIGLTKLVDKLNHGVDLGGNELPQVTRFVKGVGANPASPFLAQEIERLFKKKQAGADYVITQPVFEAELLLKFVDRIKQLGLAVIAGIWPLASYRNAVFLNNEVPGVCIPAQVMERMRCTTTKEEGLAVGVQIAKELVAAIRPAVCGIQVSPPFGRVETALAVIR